MAADRPAGRTADRHLIFAIAHEGKFPPEFVAIQAQLVTPKVLACRADSNHPVAVDWEAYTSANLSYEYLAPDGSEADPGRVLIRCLVHGSVGLCDGSVQMNSADHPLKTVNRQGKLYLE